MTKTILHNYILPVSFISVENPNYCPTSLQPAAGQTRLSNLRVKGTIKKGYPRKTPEVKTSGIYSFQPCINYAGMSGNDQPSL